MQSHPIPTYTFSEVKSFIRLLDLSALDVLSQLIHGEIYLYPFYEGTAIFRLIEIQKKAVAVNELQLEFLLAYN